MCSSLFGVAAAFFKREESDNIFVVGGYLGESGHTKVGCCIIESCEHGLCDNLNGEVSEVKLLL